MIRGLIIGYGRAGKRHGKLLDELGIEWMTVDPFLGDRFPEFLGVRFFSKGVQLQDVLDKKSPWDGWYDFAVICTPPDLHLAQIRQCLDAGLPVLCEKPLCGLGQLAEAEALLGHLGAGKVMMAYNYRWHPKLREAKARGQSPYLINCIQYRNNLPEWGLLLDHVSHDLDIARFLLGGIKVENCYHELTDKYDYWSIACDPISIREKVSFEPVNRVARLHFRDGDEIDLDPDPAMYTAMWAAFLSGEYEPGLEEAIKTQRMLEKCQELAR